MKDTLPERMAPGAEPAPICVACIGDRTNPDPLAPCRDRGGVMSGPYETERDARAAAINAGGPAEPDWSILSPGQRYKLLLNACADAGVFLGDYDHCIIAWLAEWDDATCAVIAGLITRAHAGRAAPGGPGQAQRGGGWISGPST